MFEPQYTTVRRTIGHPSAPVMTDSMIQVMKARLLAATELRAGRVADKALAQARDAHLFAYADTQPGSLFSPPQPRPAGHYTNRSPPRTR